MYDKGKVLLGLAIFVVAALSIVGYNMSLGEKAAFRTDGNLGPEKPVGHEKCVKETAYMQTSHMVLLNQWRDEVIREGKRELVVTPAGEEVEKSLQNGCLSCHVSKVKFCDRCHEYANVAPYCWDCHLAPVETPAGKEAH
jgi:hypothetical protein